MPGEELGASEQTIRGQVMHDLGIWDRDHKSSPSMREAQRFAIARMQAVGMPLKRAVVIAHTALRDWRTTIRVTTMSDTQTITDILGRVVVSDQAIGVIVKVKLTYPAGKPPGAREEANVLINVLPSATKADIIDAAVTAWNSGQLQSRKGPYESVATGGVITQVVVGGYPQAQVSLAGPA